MERKKKKVDKKKQENKPTAHEATYFKLCHFCFHLNEADQPIMDCTQCANLLSSEPIEEFYEDVFGSVTTARTVVDEDDDETAASVLPNPELRGLSVIWYNNSPGAARL